jgi:hypothetical protein
MSPLSQNLCEPIIQRNEAPFVSSSLVLASTTDDRPTIFDVQGISNRLSLQVWILQVHGNSVIIDHIIPF